MWRSGRDTEFCATRNHRPVNEQIVLVQVLVALIQAKLFQFIPVVLGFGARAAGRLVPVPIVRNRQFRGRKTIGSGLVGVFLVCHEQTGRFFVVNRYEFDVVGSILSAWWFRILALGRLLLTLGRLLLTLGQLLLTLGWLLLTLGWLLHGDRRIGFRLRRLLGRTAAACRLSTFWGISRGSHGDVGAAHTQDVA